MSQALHVSYKKVQRWHGINVGVGVIVERRTLWVRVDGSGKSDVEVWGLDCVLKAPVTVTLEVTTLVTEVPWPSDTVVAVDEARKEEV